jgi:hypothetical protein
MEDDPLRASDRDSVVVTRSSINPPAVAETVLFAFKSNAARTRAYQADLLPTLNLTRRYADVVSSQISDQQQTLVSTERILVKEPADLFVLGADFAGAGTTMTVASRASYNGKEYVIRLSIEIEGGPIKIVQAPYFSMLKEAKDPDDLLLFSPKREAFNAPIQDRLVTRVFSGTALPMNLLYVVDQPVSLLRADGGRMCIMAPAYSPAPIPPSTFSCDFIR